MHRKARHAVLACGLPADTLEKQARVTLYGCSSAWIEGQRGVVELGTEQIRLRTGCGVLCIRGKGLVLRELSLDAAMIEGERIDAAGYVLSESL
ncbi:MAG: YabP/YqfC family sporulation protein [Clostridia bacterium]|nr:YabP/YqfC family sporulation protein [Clostridia bacterium]MBQ4609741.1 YabP/YqfC family sporulation protein [Clostridia bacterium]MBQ6859840.1 YabP/YqfC family sporulation protein [Clostridia bacterium]MBQ7053311.1 YabP/YqfC family sporulation protein [Clostridia bacterium]